MNYIPSKTCKTCNNEKPLTDFAKNKNCKDGHLTECKECNKLYRKKNAKHRCTVEKKRRHRNGVKPKKVFGSEKERKVAHTEACKRWQTRNKKRVDEYNKWYRETFREKCLSRVRIWREANPHKVAEYTERRGGYTKWATPVWITGELLKPIYLKCQQLTKETGIVYQVDHFYPLLGTTVCGLHTPENLQIITKAENLSKGNKHPEEFYI